MIFKFTNESPRYIVGVSDGAKMEACEVKEGVSPKRPEGRLPPVSDFEVPSFCHD